MAGNDVKDWSTDDAYFSRVFKNYAETKSKPDGTDMAEKVLTKEDGEKALRQILNEKLDYKGEALKTQEDKLITNFFGDNWDYYDPGNEGFIETSRAF